MKILLCTDGGRHATQAARFVTDLLHQKAEAVLFHVKEGNIAKQICLEAEKGYDLVVLGSRTYEEGLAGVTEVLTREVEEALFKELTKSLFLVRSSRPVKKVLIATDDSKDVYAAMQLLSKLQLEPGCLFNLLHVLPSIYPRFSDYIPAPSERDLEALAQVSGKRTEYLYRAKALLAELAIEAKVKLREGEAAEEILKESQNNYDLIVMGLRGRKATPDKPVGRQARRVMRQALMPVLAVRA